MSLIILINCMLFGLAYGIIGQNVKFDIKNHLSFVVSISGKLTTRPTDPKHIHNLHICTGSLVSHKSVLTAAHCLTKNRPNEIQIIAGSTSLSSGKVYYPESWITFDQWNHNQTTAHPMNDIAVIRMEGEGIRNPNIRLAIIMHLDSKTLFNREVEIRGWGKIATGQQPIVLKTAKFNVVSNEECSVQGTMLTAQNYTVHPNYFCTKAEPYVLATPGDSGAPITDKNRHLVGINIGTCPKVDGYPQEMLNELEMNCNLNFYYYRDFLQQVILK